MFGLIRKKDPIREMEWLRGDKHQFNFPAFMRTEDNTIKTRYLDIKAGREAGIDHFYYGLMYWLRGRG